MDMTRLRDSMKKVLSEKRYIHSLGVEEVCHDLALIYGADIEKAEIAGILHDCAKYLTKEEFLSEAKRYRLPISPYERDNPYMLHAKLGLIYAREKYGINDEEILNAILFHTTGRPNMTLLEKIVYVSDYIEPNRKPFPGLDEAREVAYRNLDEAVIIVSKCTLYYLNEKGVNIDPATKTTYEYYVNQANI
ncbi:MAG: HD domain-containing protein [Clostridiales bacterium]|nr:HD domain-containing protein [Clostridiales bacterium]